MNDMDEWEDFSFLLKRGMRAGAPHEGWIYRLWGIYQDPFQLPDDDERLLYIGQTRHALPSRLNAHAHSSPFWLRLTKIEARPVDWLELDAVEYAEIHFHHPPFNRMCRQGCDYYQLRKSWRLAG